ncbi:MAG: hypothetical protein ACKVU1_13220 [bacterium]
MTLALLKIGFVILLAGGTGWLLKLPRRTNRTLAFDSFVISNCAGWALSIIFLYSFVELFGARAFWIPLVTGAAGWALAAATLLRRRFVIEWRVPRFHALALLALGIILFVTTAQRVFPLSHDAVVHCFVAEKIRESARLCADWEPWGPIPIHYTQGLHLFIAMASRITGEAVPQVFQALLFWFGLGGVLAFYVVARAFLSSARSALVAVAILTFACNSGTFFDYVSWGGMPTLLSQLYFLCVIVLLVSRECARCDVVLAGTFLAGLTMTSQVGAFITAWVLGAYIAVLLVRKRDSHRARFLVASLAWQFAFSISILWIYLPKLGTIARTDALRFTVDSPVSAELAVLLVGVPVLPLAALGVFAARRDSKLIREPQFLAIWAIALAGGTLFWDRVYRFAAEIATGESFSAFVPSRFLTVMAAPLAIIGAAWLASAMKSRARAAAAYGTIAAACVAGAILHVWPVVTAPGIAPDRVALYEWVRASTPKNAFILYEVDLEPTWWRYYLVGRDMCNVPIPSGEVRDDPRLVEKNAACDTRDLARLREWLSSQEKRAFVLASAATAQARQARGFRFAGEHGEFALLEMAEAPSAIAGAEREPGVRGDEVTEPDERN